MELPPKRHHFYINTLIYLTHCAYKRNCSHLSDTSFNSFPDILGGIYWKQSVE